MQIIGVRTVLSTTLPCTGNRTEDLGLVREAAEPLVLSLPFLMGVGTDASPWNGAQKATDDHAHWR